VATCRSIRAALLAIALLVGLLAHPLQRKGHANDAYPARPIRLIVPFPAGGGADIIARIIMSRVVEKLGGTIVFENRAGAGGNIGAAEAARAQPDGYTLLYGTNGTLAINHALYRSTGFDPIKDFVPVSRLTEIGLVLVVNPAVPAQTFGGLWGLLRTNPDRLTVASAGNGTTSHMAAELLSDELQLKLTKVHFRGGNAAMTDLLSGQVQMMVEVMPNALGAIDAGQLRALAVTTRARWPAIPNVPTFEEAGFPGMTISAWDAIVAPRGTDPAVVARLHSAIQEVLADNAVQSTLRDRGATPVLGTSIQLARHVEAELQRWSGIVKRTGAKIE
jgi:tripartite-type tricarboxylate transporter receptor subunit TctC